MQTEAAREAAEVSAGATEDAAELAIADAAASRAREHGRRDSPATAETV